MRPPLRCLVALPLFVTVAFAQPSYRPPVGYEEADVRAGEILAKMSTAEKLQIVSGHNSFFIRGFPQYGLPQLYLSDATAGVNIRRNLSNALEKSVAFPAPIGLASTWDPALAAQYARSVGEECRAGGVAVLLGPGMNLYRISQEGRNFEYFGEDPFLASRLIEKYVTGVLETGTIPTLKHFVGNETDFHRRTSNSIIDERTLHEIYLPAFKAGIDAGAMAVMTSYNQLNGEWCGQSSTVINDLLRGELGFKWLVMTDWWSVWDAEKIMKSGQDLEMPGEKFLKADGDRMIQTGRVPVAALDRMVKSILRTEIAMGLLDRPVAEPYYLQKYSEHEAVALQTAREAIVLLRNREQLLPISKEGVTPILVTGRFVDKLARGGGAADVEGYDQVTLLAGLQAVYGNRIHFVKTPTDAELSSAATVILSTGTADSEGWDRPFALPAQEEDLLKRVTRLNKRTVVVVNSGGGVRMTDWNDAAGAIVYAWYPGQSGNRALAEILSGEVNPSGKLPITIEREFEDSPGYGYLPKGQNLYVGWEGDNDMSQPINRVEYKEGVMVGYRWYENKRIAPLYAFGHGLSYTSFAYSNLRVTPDEVDADGRVTVEFSVRNTGAVPGVEVAQLYLRDPDSKVVRPVKELKGFSRVSLQPGETRTVRIRLTKKDFSYWDATSHGWVAEPGAFGVLVGASSDSISLEGGFTLR